LVESILFHLAREFFVPALLLHLRELWLQLEIRVGLRGTVLNFLQICLDWDSDHLFFASPRALAGVSATNFFLLELVYRH
jgi:hypothetical protein